MVPVLVPRETTLHVLLVEDNDADAEFLIEALDAPGRRAAVDLVRAVRLADALDALRTGHFDVVLLDLSLPDAEGLQSLDAVVAAVPDVPVIVTTGLADDAVAARAVQAGAQDYLVKGLTDAPALRHAVPYAIERHRLARERQALLDGEREARAAAEHAARARDETLGIVSHDLRNPLTTIGICARALGRASDAEHAELAQVIAQSSDLALRIIRDLLDVTAIEAGRVSILREPMTVGAIVDTLRTLFAPQADEAGVTWTVHVERAPRWIDADVDRLVQALGNLVGNAIKFTPRHGHVSLTVAGSPDGAVRFHVSDTGPGIGADDLPHLFDRFWQAHRSRRGGAGLGLAIAKGIAEAHGGRVDVASTPGGGSTFTLTLPPPAPVPSAPASTETTAAGSTHVLPFAPVPNTRHHTRPDLDQTRRFS